MTKNTQDEKDMKLVRESQFYLQLSKRAAQLEVLYGLGRDACYIVAALEVVWRDMPAQ